MNYLFSCNKLGCKNKLSLIPHSIVQKNKKYLIWQNVFPYIMEKKSTSLH